MRARNTQWRGGGSPANLRYTLDVVRGVQQIASGTITPIYSHDCYLCYVSGKNKTLALLVCAYNTFTTNTQYIIVFLIAMIIKN